MINGTQNNHEELQIGDVVFDSEGNQGIFKGVVISNPYTKTRMFQIKYNYGIGRVFSLSKTNNSFSLIFRI